MLYRIAGSLFTVYGFFVGSTGAVRTATKEVIYAPGKGTALADTNGKPAVVGPPATITADGEYAVNPCESHSDSLIKLPTTPGNSLSLNGNQFWHHKPGTNGGIIRANTPRIFNPGLKLATLQCDPYNKNANDIRVVVIVKRVAMTLSKDVPVSSISVTQDGLIYDLRDGALLYQLDKSKFKLIKGGKEADQFVQQIKPNATQVPVNNRKLEL